MTPVIAKGLRPLLVLTATLALFACGGGGGGGSSSSSDDNGGEPTTPVPTPTPPVEPLEFNAVEASRFLSQATFGPTADEIDEVVASGPEAWLLDELDKPATLHLEYVLSRFPEDGRFFDERGNTLPGLQVLPAISHWRAIIEGDDQLRQRMAYALSQILVVSADSTVGRAPQTLAHYADILTRNAFGNFRDLLEEVTYSPAMAIYLTYLRNEKADPVTGRVPDENYAREVLQLFTIGLVALNPDGTPVENADGSETELYDNSDITELAKVFTGLSWAGTGFTTRITRMPLAAFYSPLQMFDSYHSTEAKNFLGANIPAGTGGEASLDMALDAIFNHPNVGPFISRQLIQRFVTSAPAPGYVERVTAAFDGGNYALPGGESVGSGQRGDLAAVIAAVLFDSDARDEAMLDDPTFGKLREPVLRFTHWARAFEVNSADASNQPAVLQSIRPEALGQQPFLSPSVFNFYRPGYVAAGTQTGAAGLTAPELQITNASSIVGYPNFLTVYAFENAPGGDSATFVPDYSSQLAVAGDIEALLDNLDLLFTHGTLQPETRARITDVLGRLGSSSDEDRLLRVRIASVMVMSSPEYIVQR